MTRPNALRLLTAAALSAATLSAAAADVQLYGRIETALFFQKVESEDNSKLQLENGASRLGLIIREDISSDLSARGYLETGFNSDDGGLTNTSGGNTGTMLFDRRSIVALHSKTFGEFGFGRMGTVRSTMAPYGWGLGSLDPFETAYAVDCSISGVFGNDARGNNSFTWLSPKWSGLQIGTTYSLSTTDQENDQSRENNRQLAGLVTYEAGPALFVLGATNQWFGDKEDVSTESDKGKAYKRQNAQAYTLGMTYQATDKLKLFLAAQYHKDWRSVGGWAIDSWYAKGNAADAEHGIDGTTALIGAQFWPTPSIRLIGDYMYFDGEHEMGNGDTIDAKRHVVNGAFEYYFSKTTKAYVALSYSTGSGALGSDATVEQLGATSRDVNRVTGHIGIQKRF